MEFKWPWNADADGGAGAPGDGTIPWRNENVGAGIEGSIIPAEVPHDVQTEIINTITSAGLTPDPDDLTQLYQAIIALTRVQQTPGFDTGVFEMYVPSEYPTIQDAMNYLAGLTIANDVMVHINVAAGDINITPATDAIVLAHPNMDRIEIIGAPITGFPAMVSMNQASAAATEAAVRSIWPTRLVLSGGVYAGVYVKGGTFGRIKNIAFIGDGTNDQHGCLIGDWSHGIGAGGVRFENCWAHRCGEDGFRANYNSQIISTNIGASWCGANGFRIANGSLWTFKDYSYACRNILSGFMGVDLSFIEFTGVTGGAESHNNGQHGFASFGNSDMLINQGCISKNNTGNGWYSGENGYLTTNSNTGMSGGGNAVDVKSEANGRMHFASLVAQSLTASPTVNTLGNNNSYILG